jgi:regulator of sigma E protease
MTLDGAPLKSWEALLDRIGASAGTPLRLGIMRKGQPIEIQVTPVAETVADPETGTPQHLGRIGMMASEGFAKVTIGDAFGQAWRLTIDNGSKIFSALRALSHGVGVKDLGGPIAIAQVSVQAARSGLDNLFALIALISINVAVFNLLPIPILDGGQIALNIAETVRGRAFSSVTRERILKGGLVIIGLLFVTVMFNDISRNMQNILRLVGRIFGRSA